MCAKNTCTSLLVNLAAKRAKVEEEDVEEGGVEEEYVA